MGTNEVYMPNLFQCGWVEQRTAGGETLAVAVVDPAGWLRIDRGAGHHAKWDSPPGVSSAKPRAFLHSRVT